MNTCIFSVLSPTKSSPKPEDSQSTEDGLSSQSHWLSYVARMGAFNPPPSSAGTSEKYLQ